MNISAIIVVKNSPPHLFETLHSIEGFVSEIIIGDISIDPNIKKKLETNSKYSIVSLDPETSYVELVREELKLHAKNEFILYLDSDEIFPSHVLNILSEKKDEFDCFYFPRKNIIFGKWMEHSRWWPDYQLRFFRRTTVSWPKKIHTDPVVNGKVYKFPPEEKFSILHYNYENLDEFMSKMIRYAKSDALERISEKSNFTISSAINLGISEFISRFFAHDGYKDGLHGFALSFLQMFYYFLVFFYYWELKKYPDIPHTELTSTVDTYFKQGLYETKFWKDKKGLGSSSEKIKMKIIKRM